jgi:hypothetical protein
MGEGRLGVRGRGRGWGVGKGKGKRGEWEWELVRGREWPGKGPVSRLRGDLKISRRRNVRGNRLAKKRLWLRKNNLMWCWAKAY